MKILIKTDNTEPAAETGLPTKRQQEQQNRNPV